MHAHHGHNHADPHGDGTSNIRVAFFLNLFFCVIELIGGVMTNSIAILSDALHDLGDSFSLALAWYFQKLSKRKPDQKYSYGYRRFSLLGALINSLVLLLGSLFIVVEAVKRIASPQEAHAEGMFWLAILGILINGMALLRLRKGDSLNERAVALHFVEDVLGWVAVLIASIVMMFVDLPILDPILSLAIACFILFNIYRNLRDTFRVMLQGTPATVETTQVEEEILKIEGVQSVHDLHLWSVDGAYHVLTLHVVMDRDLGRQEVIALKERVRALLTELNLRHVTIELEFPEERCDYGVSCPEADGL